MKCCLSYQQSDKVLEEVDEIYISIDYEYNTQGRLYDLAKKFPDKTFIVEMPYGATEPGDWIESLSKEVHVVCELKKLAGDWKKGVDFFYKYPIGTYYELDALRRIGAYYAVIGIPLFFEMNQVKPLAGDTKIRVAPNVAYYNYFPFGDGVCGQWIRPEDLSSYEDYIDSIFFYNAWAEKEKRLYQIYMKDREWKGSLDSIIENLDLRTINPATYNYDNGLVIARQNCGQKCMKGYPCHICQESLIFGQKLKNYLDESL